MRRDDAGDWAPFGDAWVSGYFGEDDRDSVEPLLTADRTAAEVSFMLATTGLRPSGRVVDFGCGHGRHPIEFARRGIDVTGVDVNAGARSRGAGCGS